MRKMSAMLIFCLSAAAILSLGGCKDEPQTELTPFELYQQAYRSLQAEDSIEYAVNSYLDMQITAPDSAPGSALDTVSLAIDGNIKQVKTDDTLADFALDMDLKVPFVNIGADMQMYHTDDWLYMAVPDYDIAYKLPMAVLQDDMPQQAAGEMACGPITEDMLLSSSVNSAGNTITLILDGTKLNEQMASAADPGLSITVNDIPIDVKLDENGDIISYIADIDMQVKEGDIDIVMQLDVTLDIVGTGNVTIDFPDNLSNYTEISPEDFIA